MGVFTTKQFKKGMFLLQYSGDIISKKEGEKREMIYGNENRSYMFFFIDDGKDLWLVQMEV